jgi:hypothetical protein
MANGEDREWTRLCLAVEDFRVRYGCWPDRVRLDPECLRQIRDEILSPAAFAKVAAKIELVPEEDATYTAEDGDGRRFRYGKDPVQGNPDDLECPAEQWFGLPQDGDPGSDEKYRHGTGSPAAEKIDPQRVRYIKLGPKGSFEKECLDSGTARFGFATGSVERYPLCRDARWDELERSFLAEGHQQGSATNFANQARQFFEDDGSTLWVTFSGDRLYWGFLDPAPPVPHPGGQTVVRTVQGGWRSTDLAGVPLTKDRLAGSLTKVAAFRGTSCEVDVAAYVVRRINGETTPEVERAVAALEEMTDAALGMIKLLEPKDFEVLVDLVFSTSGWRRQGVVGKTTKTLDLDLLLPSTGERAFVQVKSKTDSKELAEYVARFEAMSSFDRMFFVYHTGEAATDDERVTVIGPERLAEMAVEAGLVTWLIRKVA